MHDFASSFGTARCCGRSLDVDGRIPDFREHYRVDLCRMLDSYFGELPFHAVSILEDGCGRRLGAAT
jgi:hypothetical protein